MGFYIHFGATFSGDSDALECVKPVTEKHRAALDRESDLGRYAGWLLDATLDPKQYNCGPKGDLFTWGIEGCIVLL